MFSFAILLSLNAWTTTVLIVAFLFSDGNNIWSWWQSLFMFRSVSKRGVQNFYTMVRKTVLLRSLHFLRSLLNEVNCFLKSNLHHFRYDFSNCFHTIPLSCFSSALQTVSQFSMFQDGSMHWDISAVFGENAFKITNSATLQCGDFGEPGKEIETIIPSRQLKRSFEASPGLRRSEDCRFMKKVLILWSFLVIDYGMKV